MKQGKHKNHKIPHIYDNISVIPVKFDLVGGFNHLKNISQWEGLSHIWNGK